MHRGPLPEPAFPAIARLSFIGAKVAAEIARIGGAPMDYEVVKAIVAEEEHQVKLQGAFEHVDDRPS